MRRFGKVLIKRRIMINALRNSLMMGTLSNMINQGRQFLNGLEIAWEQVLLNFMVPYVVACYRKKRTRKE
mgnify:FL=1